MIKLDYQYVGRGVLGYPASSNNAPPVLDQAILWGDIDPSDSYVYLIDSPLSPVTAYVGTASNLDAKLREYVSWLESAGLALYHPKTVQKEVVPNGEPAPNSRAEEEPLFYEYQEDEFIWKNDGVSFIGSTDPLEGDCYLKWHIFKPRVAVSGDEKIYEFGGKIWNTVTKRYSALQERKVIDGPSAGRLYFHVSNYDLADTHVSALVYLDVEWTLARLIGRAMSGALFPPSSAPHENRPTNIAGLRIEELQEQNTQGSIQEKLRNVAKAGRCKNNLLEQIADWSLGVKPAAKHVRKDQDEGTGEYIPSALSGKSPFDCSCDREAERQKLLRDKLFKPEAHENEKIIAAYRYRETFLAVDISLSVAPALVDDSSRKQATDDMIAKYLQYSLDCQRDDYYKLNSDANSDAITQSGPARWRAGEEL